MKKIWMICLLLLALLVLAGCTRDEKNAGEYTCVAVEGEKSAPSNVWLRLDADGTGAIRVGLELDMKWDLDGNNLTVETEFVENTYTGTLQNCIARLEIDGVRYTFVQEGAEELWEAIRESEIATEPPAPVTLDEMYTGRYLCTAISDGSGERTPKGEWIALKSDGTAELHLDMEYPGSWYAQAGQLIITANAGTVYTGTLEDGILQLTGDREYTFRKAGLGEQNVVAGSTSPLRIGTRWHGILEITDYEGEGELQNGTFEIVALIGENDGAYYFEVYFADDQEGKPILSFWTKLFENYLEPVIDEEEEDSWLFDIYLEREDIWEFTMFLGDENELTADYDYETRDEECELYFTFYPDMEETE